jgi:ferredoxin
MNILLSLFIAVGTAVSLFLALLCVTSLIERKTRVALISLLFLVIFAGIWFGGFWILLPNDVIVAIAVIVVALPMILFFLPIGKNKPLKITNFTEQVDERDVIFSRADYEPGTEHYKTYYKMRPEKKEMDDKIRKLPELLSPGGKYYDLIRSDYVRSLFDFEESQVTRADGPVNPVKHSVDPVEISRTLKNLTLHLGADEVGIAKLNPAYVYSHVGRGPELWGEKINNNHPYAITFTVEMDYSMVEEAPEIGITEETALQYLNAQRISIVLARYIRKLGYEARAHVSGSNYQIMLPPVASDAGLGELGRLGYLISPRFGARIRLGAITTDIPLVLDKPIQFGVQDFCEKCKKCAVNCPSGAIPDGDKSMIRGAEKWQLDIEKCYYFWRVIGTDCGLCMKVCPFSHPDTLAHNILRQGIKRSSFARSISVYGDDLFYGKKVKLD